MTLRGGRRACLLGLLAVGAAVLVWRSSGTGEPPPVRPPEFRVAGAPDPGLADAVGWARSEVIREPRSGDAWGRLGKLLLANGYAESAATCLAQAARLDPDEPRWPYFRALAAERFAPGECPALLRDALDRGERTRDPACPFIRLRYAERLFAEDHTGAARDGFGTVLRDDPGNVRARFGLGLVALAQDRPEEAAGHFRACVDSPACGKKACAQLAAAARRLGDLRTAEEFGRRAERLPPDGFWHDPLVAEYAQLNTGRQARFFEAQREHRSGKLRAAEAIVRDVLAGSPDDTRGAVMLGMILAETGRFAEAERVLREALPRASDSVLGWYFLAVAVYHQVEHRPAGDPGVTSRLDEAEAAARRVVTLKPDHALAHLYRGLCLDRLGQPEDAVAAFRLAVETGPDSADPPLHLGRFLRGRGWEQEGVFWLRRAAALSRPGDDRARDELRRAGAMN